MRTKIFLPLDTNHFKAGNIGFALGLFAMLLIPQTGMARSAPDSFSSIAKKVTPAVVNIQTEQAVEQAGQMPPGVPEGPFREFFERFFGDQFPGMPDGGPDQGGRNQRPRRAQGAGSGFIIDSEGLIVTNNHVVGEADEITVTLQDGAEFKAELIGRDSKTDLALIKIKTNKSLPFVKWGNSDQLEVGDWVVAVGNPFGLGGSVTAGIVSARGRDIRSGPYDDFIQTDASINRGNSGGPLFDMEGMVVGVNTAIFSPTGGNIGIGFAIPSKMARNIIAQLRTGKTIKRGWLGVQIQQVTQEIAESLVMDEPKGALVGSVNPGGPADKGGIRTGDVILKFAGQEVLQMRSLPRIVAETDPGSDVKVEILRQGKRETLVMNLGIMPDSTEELAFSSRGKGKDNERAGIDVPKLGLKLAALNNQLRAQFQLSEDQNGVVVIAIDQDNENPLQTGDVITMLNQMDINSLKDIEKALAKTKRSRVLALISRNGQERFIPLTLQAG